MSFFEDIQAYIDKTLDERRDRKQLQQAREILEAMHCLSETEGYFEEEYAYICDCADISSEQYFEKIVKEYDSLGTDWQLHYDTTIDRFADAKFGADEALGIRLY